MESDDTCSVGAQTVGEAVPIDDEAVTKTLTDGLTEPLTNAVSELTQLIQASDPTGQS